jgi:hypothetical protein
MPLGRQLELDDRGMWVLDNEIDVPVYGVDQCERSFRMSVALLDCVKIKGWLHRPIGRDVVESKGVKAWKPVEYMGHDNRCPSRKAKSLDRSQELSSTTLLSQLL